jgi:hypothetical protein
MAEKKKQYNMTISFGSEEERDTFKEFCKTHAINMSEFVRRAIRRELERFGRSFKKNY